MQERLVVGFDTSTDDVAVAVARGSEVLSERLVGPRSPGRPRHAVALLREVDEAVAAGGGWHAVELIAVGVGPGSFTGLRVGVSSARALGQASGAPIAAVDSLQALAAGIADAAPAGSTRGVLAVSDARRGEVFWELAGPGGSRPCGPRVSSPSELAQRLAELEERPLAAGSGAVRFRPEIEAGAEILPDGHPAHRISARHVCALGRGAPPDGPGAIRPIYLRRPDADLWRERNRRTADR